MADVRAPEGVVRDTPHRDHLSAACELTSEREPSLDLCPGRWPVRPLVARVSRDDVPEQHAVADPEPTEHGMDDRGCRLGESAPGHLALGGEWDAGDTRAAVPGRLCDQDHPCVRTGVEVRGKPFAQERRPVALIVEVERRADARRREAVDEVALGPCGDQATGNAPPRESFPGTVTR